MNKLYYVIYENYTEYNQFEGCWDWVVKEFDSEKKAREFANKIRPSQDTRKLIGPVQEV